MDYAEANGLFFTETAQNVSELFYLLPVLRELGKCSICRLSFSFVKPSKKKLQFCVFFYF